jgi:hypothetical protein
MSRRTLANLALMVAAFVLCTVIAEILGAPNLGTAMTFGQIGFTLTAVYVLMLR